MRHQPFVQALTECDSADLSQWAALCSGLLVLRQFDEWLDTGPSRTTEDRDAVARVRQQIGTIPDSAQEVRYLLETVLDVVEQAKPTDVIGAVGPLLAYGSYLECTEQQRLGQHVLSIVTDVLDSPVGATDLQSVASAYLQHGRVAHRAGSIDDAEALYTRGIVLAEHAGDYPLSLHGKIRLGMLCNTRANFADAEAILDTVVLTARKHQLTEVEVDALLVRGGMFQHSARQVEAIRDLSVAYSLTPSQSMREILLGDIAACACELGLWQAACAIQEKLARTARNAVARACALINLLETAVLRGDQDKYHALWLELQTHHLESMPSDMNLCAQFYAAQGVERFESVSKAITSYRALATRANELGTHLVERMIRDRLDTVLARENPQL